MIKKPASEKSRQSFKKGSSTVSKRVFEEMILADQRRKECILAEKVRELKRRKKELKRGKLSSPMMGTALRRDFFVGWS